MNIIQKYYRWRASRAKTASGQAHYKRKAYRWSHSYRNRTFGFDLTFFSDPQAMKEELTADIGKIEPSDESRRFDYKNEHNPGRYANGPLKMWTDEKGNPHDDTDWRETPQWWGNTEEANQQHMPTRFTRGKPMKAIGYNIDPVTGRRKPFGYDYKAGKQVEL